MAAGYNSKLISELYAATNQYEAERVLEEMGEIKDLVFVVPIFDAYKRFKDGTMSHYFLSHLQTLESRETLEIFKEIEADPNTDPLDYSYALGGLTKYNYFSEETLARAKAVLSDYSAINHNLGLNDLLEYLEKGGAIQSVEEDVQTIFESDIFDADDRRLALRYLLKIDSTRWIGYYIENLASIRSDTQIQLARVIAYWTGTITEKLKDAIIASGNERAKEFITAARTAAKTAVVEKARQEEAIYSNGPVIAKIAEEKQKINLASSTNPEIKFDLFNQDDSLFKQMETATSEDGLNARMVDFRACIQNINPGVSAHGVSLEEAREIIESLNDPDFNKSLNQLQIFLHVKGVDGGKDLFGLRLINKAANLFAHPDKRAELLKVLAVLNLADSYGASNWSAVHKGILDAYLETLKRFSVALSAK